MSGSVVFLVMFEGYFRLGHYIWRKTSIAKSTSGVSQLAMKILPYKNITLPQRKTGLKVWFVFCPLLKGWCVGTQTTPQNSKRHPNKFAHVQVYNLTIFISGNPNKKTALKNSTGLFSQKRSATRLWMRSDNRCRGWNMSALMFRPLSKHPKNITKHCRIVSSF